MSKPGSGHFHGANGKTGGGSATTLFSNGRVTYEGIAAHHEEFMGKSADQIAELLRQNGYEVRIRRSNRDYSNAKIIEITNPSKERNIDKFKFLLTEASIMEKYPT